jgi:hypothetical protein
MPDVYPPDTQLDLEALSRVSREYPDLWLDCLEDLQRSERVMAERPARYGVSALVSGLIAFGFSGSWQLAMAVALVGSMYLGSLWHRWRCRVCEKACERKLHPEMRELRRQTLACAESCKMNVRMLQTEVGHLRLEKLQADDATSQPAP